MFIHTNAEVYTNALSSGNPPPGQPPLDGGPLPDLPAATLPLEALPYFKTFEEIQAIPGYKANVDPSATKIARLRGLYSGLKAEVPCGLTRCHQGHLSGVIVETIDGDVTNIGHVCGGRYFEEFQREKNKYDLRAAHSRRQRILKDTVTSAPIINARIDSLRTGPRGGDWAHRSYENFFKSVPSEVVNVLRERARRGEASVTIAEKVTDKEEADRIRQFQSGLSRGRSATDDVIVEREIGRLRGLGIWKDGQTVRDLLHAGVLAKLNTLSDVDIPQLRSHTLRELATWAEGIEDQLDAVEALIKEAREFFTEDNLKLLAKMSWGWGTADALRNLGWDFNTGSARNPARMNARRH